MRRWRLHLSAAAVTAALTLATVMGRASEGRAAPAFRSEADILNLDIAFYASRVGRDPHGAMDRAQLARLHLQRGRATGDHGDLVRAERMARESLELRRDRNGASFVTLASSLLAQHRFVEALEAAESLVTRDSTSLGARALLGEIQLELGRYADARRTFGQLLLHRAHPAVAPRYARWEELRGRPEIARRLLRDSRDAARRRHAMPAEQLAWFQLRLGDLALRHGRLGEAAAELHSGLKIAPDDYRVLTTAARLELLRGRPRLAIAYGERAIARVPDPAALGVLHDAHVALKDSAGAEQYFRAMAVAALGQPGPAHRAWSLFLLDHRQQVPAVLARAREELESRSDVYGWDLLAWALHQAGNAREALPAIRRAQSLGTRDALLEYHAGSIALAMGDSVGARRHLREALEINRFWHPTQPAAVRALLDSL
jgi:tetratricopeptide (TPR) repeat protein